MRFPYSFSRDKGTTNTLGSDSAPTGALTSQVDNALRCRTANLNGWPTHRIAVAYHYSGVGTAVPLRATMYALVACEQFSAWMQIGDAQMLAPEKLTFFDVVDAQDRTPFGGYGNLTDGGANSIEMVLVVEDTSAPNGTHSFAMCADSTTQP